MGIAIKEAQLVEQVTGNEKIPVSDGSGLPRAVTTEQIKEYIGNGGADNVQSDWNEENPSSDAYIKNKPTIPSEQTVTDWGFTKNTGNYSRPSSGIPKSDLASDVQSSLDKADTALQKEQYQGTISAVDTDEDVDEPDVQESYDDTEVRRMIAELEKDIEGKYGVIRMSKEYDSEGYYSLELFSTKEDEALYDSDNNEYASLLTEVKLPISVSPSNYQAELSSYLNDNVNIVFSGEELNIPFVFRAIKVTLVGNENTSYKGTLIIESSSDGIVWAERGRASNSLTSADIDDNTTISIVNVGKYLNIGKQYVRARAAFSFQDNIIESDNVLVGVITKASVEESELVIRGVYESGITPDEIHFHNIDWIVSAELMMWMADIQVSDITGTIDIEGSILFNDKNKLLSRYGNVDDTASADYRGLKLNYTKIAFDASTATIKENFFADDLRVYMQDYNTEEEFVFEVQPSSDTQNTQTKITYSVEGSGNYTMNADGTFRVRMYELSKVEQTAVVKANVSVIKSGASVVESVSKEIEVWLRPAKVGDLVYYDGTYGDASKDNNKKTVIGVCCYVAPRKADGSINEKFHNPLDKHVRLMVSLDEIKAYSDSETFKTWQFGSSPGTSNESLFSTEADGTKKELTIEGITDLYDVPNLRNLSSSGLKLANGSNTSYVNDESLRDNSDLGLENDGFKPISAESSMGDGFAYNEQLDYQNERKMDDTLIRLAGEGYAKGDMVNSGYAKTLRVIAHRNNIINHCYNGNTINGMSIPIYPVSASEGDSEIDLLAQLMTDLRNWAKSESGLGDTQYGNKWSQLYYPAASACYAYEPKVTKSGEVLAPKFRKHNWFLPTEGLLARLFWYLYRYENSKLITREDSPFAEANRKGKFIIIAPSFFRSITETSRGDCWAFGFNNGFTGPYNKAGAYMIRAISAF